MTLEEFKQYLIERKLSFGWYNGVFVVGYEGK